MNTEYFDGKYCLIRTVNAGVHCGYLSSPVGDSVYLLDSRRIYYWEEAFTLSAVSQIGFGKDSKIAMAVPFIFLLGVIEIIPCSKVAEKLITEFPVYSP